MVQVPLPLGLGGIAIPTARLTPANALGTVQFKDGATNLGIPVPVLGGQLDPRLVFGDRGRRNAANFAVLGWKTVGVAG